MIMNHLTSIIHRPEEALDIQSELIFINGMVHLTHECCKFQVPLLAAKKG